MSSQPIPATSEHRGTLHVSKSVKRRSRWVLWAIGIAVFLFIASVLGLIYMATAYVMGYEVDATTWQVRHFSFFRDPFTETQLTLIKRRASTEYVVEPMILAYNVGGPIRPLNSRWDLINISRGARWGEGEAAILFRYLETSGPSLDKTWGTWTVANPKSAPLLWSAVRDAVHLPRYERLPEIFDATRVHSDPSRLKAALDQIMLDIALEEAETQAAAKNIAAAKRAAVMGLSYGESPKLTAFLKDRPAEAELKQPVREASQ